MESREYHGQHNKDVEHQEMKIYSATNQFPELNYLGTHNKPQYVHRLGKHYHMHFIQD